MASKTLIRTGASLIKGLSNRSLLHQNTTPDHRILLSGLVGLTPQLFPSLAKPQTSIHLHETLDSHTSKEVTFDGTALSSLHLRETLDPHTLKELTFDRKGLFYPCGLPSLPLFLPDGTLSLYSDEFGFNFYILALIGMHCLGL